MIKTCKILLTSLLVLVSSLGFSQSVPSYVPTSGLVGWWGFNGNAQDGSGNGNHGTVNGATLTTDRFGNQNSAYSFDGADDYIRAINSFNLQTLNAISINVWVNFQSGGTQSPRLVSKGWSPNGIEIHTHSTLNHQVYYGGSFNGIGYSAISSTNCSLNQWYMITAVDNGNVKYIYVNGILENSFTHNYGAIPTNSIDLFFGKNSQLPTDYLSGKLDDIGIWNRALTQQEITNLYNSQLPTQTSLCLPTITTTSPSSVGTDSVVIGGNITNDGGSSIVLRGVCYSTSPNPNMGNSRTEDGSGIGSFNTVLRGLTSSTTYYARSYTKNSNGVVAYGNEVSFTTSVSLPGVRCPGTPTVTDIDGNIYNTVQIGTQCWTQSNLKVSKYRNGDNIPTGLSNADWQFTTSGAYAIYDNDPVNDGLYGKLYNWYTVNDTRGLCPSGWHVPSDGEWTILESHLGGSNVAGGALKSTAIQPTPGGWNSTNSGATNSSGFTALPGGLRVLYGNFSNLGYDGCWWSSSVSFGSSAWGRYQNNATSRFDRGYGERASGLSVRCLKD